MAIVQLPNKIEVPETEEETTNKEEESEIMSNKNSKENLTTEIAGNRTEIAEAALEALWINALIWHVCPYQALRLMEFVCLNAESDAQNKFEIMYVKR